MNKEEFIKELETTPDDGHRFWPRKLPNENLVQLGEEVVDWLIEAIDSEHSQAAAITLAGIGPVVIPKITPILENQRLRKAILYTFQMIPFLHESIDHEIPYDYFIRFAQKVYVESEELGFHDMMAIESEQSDAISILGVYKIKEAIPMLLERLNHENYLCVCACSALARIKDSTAIRPLLEVLMDEDKFWVPRGAAANALGSFRELAKEVLPEMEKALDYDVSSFGEKWDQRAKDAVEDAVNKIKDPNYKTKLRGKGFKYEMWGIY